MQRWLREEILGDLPPRRIKKQPAYKYPELLKELKNGEPGSEKFWELLPENHDLNGPGPYSIDEGYLMDRAVALDYPHLRRVQDICHELANGVDQGIPWWQSGGLISTPPLLETACRTLVCFYNTL